MLISIKRLREDIDKYTFQLKDATYRLSLIEKNCKHRWEKIISDDIHTDAYAYTIPGEKDNGYKDIFVPEKTQLRWKRECIMCGKIEYTFGTKDKIIKEPDFYEH